MSFDPNTVPPEVREAARTCPVFPDGRIDYTLAPVAPVMHCYMLCKGRVLVLQRSDRVGWLQERWHVVAGFLDSPVSLRAKVAEEINEEIGFHLPASVPMRVLPVIVEEGMGKRWVVYRTVVELHEMPLLRFNWENRQAEWIGIDELGDYELLPLVQATARELLTHKKFFI